MERRAAETRPTGRRVTPPTAATPETAAQRSARRSLRALDANVWNSDIAGPGSLRMETLASRGAQVVRVASGAQRAVLLRAIPTHSNAQTITVDLWLAVGTNAVGSWIVDFVTLRCPSPELTAAFGLASGNTLGVSSRPTAAESSFGAPVAGWQKVVITVDGGAIAATYAGQSKTITVPASFSSRVGCTLELGANVLGNIPEVTVAFSSVCVE